MTRARWIAVTALIVAVAFAVFGGSYNVKNYLALRREARDSARLELSLQHQVDSLRAYRDSLANDPAVQVRIAREQWGMVWPGEIAFRLVRDSAATRDSTHR